MNREDILKKQQEKPDFRKHQREQALRAAKESAKAAAAKKSAAAKVLAALSLGLSFCFFVC